MGGHLVELFRCVRQAQHGNFWRDTSHVHDHPFVSVPLRRHQTVRLVPARVLGQHLAWSFAPWVFWVEGTCEYVKVRDIYRLEFEVFESLGWVLFYIGAVCVFTTHMCLGWAKVVGAPALGIPKRYQNKAAHIGYVMTIGVALIYVSFPIYAHMWPISGPNESAPL